MEQKSNDAVDTNLSNPDPDRSVTNSEFVTLFENLHTEMRRILELPGVAAESLQERSLKRNQSVLGDTEMPSTSTGSASHLEPEPEATKEIKGDDLLYEDADDDYSLMTSGHGEKLGEDELTLIFSNTWLSAQDLLNSRLVSKRWRDAATTTLRRRDACVVGLWPGLDFQPLCVRKSISKFKNEHTLSQLTELITISPKFPATDFRIHISEMNFTPIPYTRFPDLLNFLKLHGDKIKTLRHHGKITARCAFDILQIYSPTLESLDLSEAELFESDEEDGSEGNASQLSSKAGSLKSLSLGRFVHYCKRKQQDTSNKDNSFGSNMSYEDYSFDSDTSNEDNSFGSDTQDSCPCKTRGYENELIGRLLSCPSKLGSIENVTLKTLQMVLTEGKEHLIRSFKYDIWDVHWVPASQPQLKKFIFSKPQLTKVTLNLDERCPTFATVLNSLNEFIESFKDTVQTLELLCEYHCRHAWDSFPIIPPMKNLKSLTLNLWTGCGDHSVPDCRVCQAEKSKQFIGIRGTFFQFHDGISSQNYFPSLMEVHLHSNLSKFNQVSPMSFFSFKSQTDDGSSAKSGFFPKVDVLEINRIDVGSRYSPAVTCHSISKTLLVAEVFPNIRILKFQCGEVSNLSSDLWALCPNVEFMEISRIGSCSSRGRDVDMSHFVDKVFTGFADRMLRSLRRSEAGHLSEADDLENLKFDPRISDLRRLRELKLKFVGKWSTKFASSVTGVHAFSKMKTTKFIISYDPNDGDDQIARYEEFIFRPLKPYVQIVLEKQKYEIYVRN